MLLPFADTTTPLADAARTIAERGVLNWIEGLHIRQGGYLQMTGHYNGEFDTVEGQEALAVKLRGALPAILVASAQKRNDSMSIRRLEFRELLEVEVLFFSNNRRSREAQNIGDQSSETDAQYDPGVYQMMDDVDALLIGRLTGDCRFERYYPVFENVVIQRPEMTMWRRRYEIAYKNSGQTEDELQPNAVFDSILHRHNLVDDDDPPPATINPVVEALTDE